MKTSNTISFMKKLWSLWIISFLCFNESFAQFEIAQRAISVSAIQTINFGAFYLTGNSGGTITVSFDGSRSSSGSIVLLSNPPVATPAIYEITLIPGRTTGIIYNPKSVLTNHDGGKLLLDVGPPDKGDNGSRFTAGSDDNFIIHLNIGGTLHIPGNAPPGNYSGSFDITFN